MLIRVTDYQDRGPADIQPRPVFLNTDYIVAMEPWGTKYKVFVGRSLEYIVSPQDAERLGEEALRAAAGQRPAGSSPTGDASP